MSETKLQKLYKEQRQSPWLDNLKRGYLTSGQLANLRDEGIRGLAPYQRGVDQGSRENGRRDADGKP